MYQYYNNNTRSPCEAFRDWTDLKELTLEAKGVRIGVMAVAWVTSGSRDQRGVALASLPQGASVPEQGSLAHVPAAATVPYWAIMIKRRLIVKRLALSPLDVTRTTHAITPPLTNIPFGHTS